MSTAFSHSDISCSITKGWKAGMAGLLDEAAETPSLWAGVACDVAPCALGAPSAGFGGRRLGRVNHEADLEAIERDGRRIIEIGRRSSMAVVPHYPTWTVLDLILHVAGVHGRTWAVCGSLAQDRLPLAERPSGDDPIAWAGEQLEGMLGALRSADPEAHVWTFIDDHRLGFWIRRMVVETGVHRWDAEGAVGTPAPLPVLVATSGLDEFAALYLGRLGDVPAIDLHATDLGHTWRFGEGEPVTTIEGPASDLFLRLMSRPGVPLPPEWEHAVDALASPADR
jgi:uncharacterized protein (TIGR03083 family)